MSLPRDNFDEWKRWSVQEKDKAIEVLSATVGVLILIIVVLLFKS